MERPRSWRIRRGGDFGAALVEVRTARGVTQADVAEHLQVDRTYVARMESAKTSRLLDRYIRALRHLGAEVTVTWTIDRPDPGA